jgi:hypothetical protein
MYEDYLADELRFEGEWYYPLSVKLAGADAIISWIKWPVNKKNFRNNIPYAYIGKDAVDFSFAGFVPNGFKDKLLGRAIDYDRDAIKLSVEALTDDVTLLAGKYSQTFVDKMAHQITAVLCRTLPLRNPVKLLLSLAQTVNDKSLDLVAIVFAINELLHDIRY